mmetsp:Transcript_2436/g.8720  ORF Transcript_2436/g.8720 Transcript_2436/m.8720 type:complete len:214 (-) Transcript_2436:751-1392(-)
MRKEIGPEQKEEIKSVWSPTVCAANTILLMQKRVFVRSWIPFGMAGTPKACPRRVDQTDIALSVTKFSRAKLIHACLGWNMVHLCIQWLHVHGSIINLCFLLLQINPAHCVLHPGLVIPLLEVFPCMSSSRFFSLFCAVHGNNSILQQVLQFHGLYQVGIPHKALVCNLHILVGFVHLVDLLAPFLEGRLRPEHSCIVLHHLLHLQSQVCCWF